MTMEFWTLWLPFSIWTVIIWFFIWGTRLTLRQLTKNPPFLDAPFALAPVSILKPMQGLDPEFKNNIKSVFELDYPNYEILFSVADSNDPIIPFIQSAQKQFPQIRSRLIIDSSDVGLSPKVNNLVKSYDEALYDWIFINDTNTRFEPSALRRMMGFVDSSTGVITALVAGKRSFGLGGKLEELALNSSSTRTMCLAFALKNPIVLGKAMLFRKTMANRFGGMETLARYLNQDSTNGDAMRMLGLKIILSGDPIEQPIGSISLATYWQRQLRRGRIRKSQLQEKYLFEFISQPFVASLFLLPLFKNPEWGLFVFSLHWILWWFCDWKLQNRVGSPMSWAAHLPLWCLRETLNFPLWWQVTFGSTMNWRNKKPRVYPTSSLESAS